jgi:hypothetical protein
MRLNLTAFAGAGLLMLGSTSCRGPADSGVGDQHGALGLSLSHWLGNDVPPPGTSAKAPPTSAAPVAAKVPLGPLVRLDGTGRALEATRANEPRIYARAAKTWIYERPSEESPHIGYLRAGAAVSIAPEIAGKGGCPGGFHAIVPRGFVCAGTSATLDANDPVVAALSPRVPESQRKLPYIYGTVRKPGPVYARLPTEAEIARVEPGNDRRMERWLSADGEVGASYGQFVWLGHPGEVPDPRAVWQERRSEGVPSFLTGGGVAPNLHQKPRDPDQFVVGHTRAKMGFSFSDTFLWKGRRYGVTPELEILPTDRLRPIQGSEFHGVELGQGVTLPLALVRQPGARYVIYERAGNRLVEGEVAPYREAVPLTGKQQFFHDVLHYETKDGKWLSDRDASRLDPAKKQPGWAVKGERWIDVNITKQSLVLYQGTTPVYATLISSGEAGLGDSEKTTATKRGIFRVHSKHVATTMSSDEVGEEFELRDVPYVQYFDDDGHAIHGAYWHDKFGIPKSHGCINLAPEDARRIFYWTDPPVPDGWHGASDALTGTVVFIHP